jgi:PAS domain S-box-containing protein
LRFIQGHVPESGRLVQFYETDRGLLESLCGFIGEGLAAGESAVVVATPEHRTVLEKLLESHGLNLPSLRAAENYVDLDAAETLSKLLVDGFPDPHQFHEIVGAPVSRMRARGAPLRVFSEMVALLWAAGNREGAVRVEQLWNDLQGVHAFALLVAYPMAAVDEGPPDMLNHIRGEDSAVIPGESFTSLRDDADRRSAVFELQRKARKLETETELRRGFEAQLRESESELKDFLDNAIDGLHRIGPDGKVLWANRAELDMLGYSPEEYIGHHISEFHVDRGLIEDVLNRLARNEAIVNCEAKMRRKDGTICLVLINSNARWIGDEFAYTRGLTRDITTMKRARQAELFLSAIIASADDAIISKTSEGIITSWNPAAERLFGYAAHEVVGKPITILIPEERGEEEKQILEKIRRGEHIDHYETRRIRKDGRIIDVSITVSPVRNEDNQVIGASKIARDITDRKQAEVRREEMLQQEQRARSAAEKANRMKDEFLATVSHELRTPLNAIIGWCHMLKTRAADPAITGRAVDTIDRNAKAQAQLVEDILDVSRVITGKLQLTIARVDLSAAINSAIDSVQLAADSKGIQMEVIADPRIRYIRGDAGRLQQVIWNLLSNAVKFTPGGGKIVVRLQRFGSEVQIMVTDSGEGISPEFLPFIFERFSQADSSTTRRQGGLGLGLAIVRHLIELHGGTVSAESRGKDLGSTFTVCLPLKGATEPIRYLPAPTPLQVTGGYAGHAIARTLEGVRVLIVDDNQDTLNMLAAHLADHNAEVETATSVAEALELLRSYQPQVLVSDVAMPNEDGYSLISRIRESEAGKENPLPAIALTALARVEDRARALSAGFNMFVPKPFEPAELVAAISHLAQNEDPAPREREH